MHKIIALILLLILPYLTFGQRDLGDSVLAKMIKTTALEKEEVLEIEVDGRVFSALIQDGDTIIVANLKNVSVSSPKRFSNQKDYYRYMKYRRYAASVFPYAEEAVRIFWEAEYATQNMRKRKRKKYNKKLSKELRKEFEKPLKKLSKTQGKILIKMIERELGKSMFQLIKNTNGWFKASYWQKASKLFGYNLKEGYSYGYDPILDVVLMDFDISQ